ncbi:MAG: hypothetical protein DRJ03_19605 [Chloroflexi bacterium]|nr:MAG: hypothetical protein DRJ03_19605 [Chloroflexota bacterium]
MAEQNVIQNQQDDSMEWEAIEVKEEWIDWSEFKDKMAMVLALALRSRINEMIEVFTKTKDSWTEIKAEIERQVLIIRAFLKHTELAGDVDYWFNKINKIEESEAC